MDPFSSPVAAWQRLDPAYLRLKRLLVLLVWPVETLLAALLVGWLWQWWAALAVVVLGGAWTAWRWWRQPRLYQAWGYAERETDLYIRQGLWRRRLTVVPYGRMQVVTVNSGPVERRYGLATVTLETASAGTHAHIPGLTGQAAAELRERLTELGETQMIGL